MLDVEVSSPEPRKRPAVVARDVLCAKTCIRRPTLHQERARAELGPRRILAQHADRAGKANPCVGIQSVSIGTPVDHRLSAPIQCIGLKLGRGPSPVVIYTTFPR